MFTRFDINKEFGPSSVAEGQLLRTLKHDSVPGAYTYDIKVDKGLIVFSVSRGTLQEVSYRYKSFLPWVRARYVRELLESYATDGEWLLHYEDKSGKMYQSAGEQLYAAVGKGARYVNIGSMLFHEEKFRIIS